MSAWVYRIFLLTILVAHLHIWIKQATIILMLTNIIMNNNDNSILLMSVLGDVPAIIQYRSGWSSSCHDCSLVFMRLAFSLWWKLYYV